MPLLGRVGMGHPILLQLCMPFDSAVNNLAVPFVRSADPVAMLGDPVARYCEHVGIPDKHNLTC